MKILCINCKPNFDFFTKRGLILDISYGVTYQKFPPIKVGVTVNASGETVETCSPDVFRYLDTLYKNEKYDAIFFGWKPEDYPATFAYTGGQTFRQKLSNGAYFATTRQDGQNYEAHELMHIIGQILYIDIKKYDAVDQMDSTWVDGKIHFYYKNDFPDDPDGNFGRTWDTYKKYLPELNNLNKMPTYKYFKTSEIVGLKPELVEKLDRARDLAGVPFIIDSGLRTQEHNATLPDAVSNSAHLTGEACDIRCKDSVTRFKMLNALQMAGFKRIGIGKNFLHADISKTLPQNVYWHYYK